MSLWADFQNNANGRLIHKWKHYFPAYERHLAPFVGRSATVIEIGIAEGGSLQMWKRFFGPHAQIIGIDIVPRCKAYEEDQIAVRIGSQDDPEFLAAIVAEFGPPDVVLDDGSHIMAHVAASFDVLYRTLSKNGVYLIEDLHTAYHEEYGGALHGADSFIERAKGLVDELNADFTRGQLEPTEFTRTTHSICFYDSLVVFERGTYSAKLAPQIGKVSSGFDDGLAGSNANANALHLEIRSRQEEVNELRAELERHREGLRRAHDSIFEAEAERQRLNAEIEALVAASAASRELCEELGRRLRESHATSDDLVAKLAALRSESAAEMARAAEAAARRAVEAAHRAEMEAARNVEMEAVHRAEIGALRGAEAARSAAMHERLDRAEALLAGIFNSTSWRATQPLRFAAIRLRALAGLVSWKQRSGEGVAPPGHRNDTTPITSGDAASAKTSREGNSHALLH